MGTEPGADGDDALIERARGGEARAREELYVRFERPLREYLNRTVGRRLSRAVSLSDLCQETFVRAFDALRILPDEATVDDFRGILWQHARWYVGKQVEKHKGFAGESALGELPLDEATPETLASAGDVTRLDELEWLHGLVERLPTDQAVVLRKRFAGHPFAVIGEDLGIPEDTARKRYLRATVALKKLIDSRRASADEPPEPGR